MRICWNTGETLGVHWVEGKKQLTSSLVEGHQLLVEVLPMLPDKDLNWLRAWPHLAEAVKIFYLETFCDAKTCKFYWIVQKLKLCTGCESQADHKVRKHTMMQHINFGVSSTWTAARGPPSGCSRWCRPSSACRSSSWTWTCDPGQPLWLEFRVLGQTSQ